MIWATLSYFVYGPLIYLRERVLGQRHSGQQLRRGYSAHAALRGSQTTHMFCGRAIFFRRSIVALN